MLSARLRSTSAVLVFTAGCSRLVSLDDAAVDDELGDASSESEGDSDESNETVAIDGESGPIEADLPAAESTTSDCEEHSSSGLYLLALETPLGPDTPLLALVELDLDCLGEFGAFEFQWLSSDSLHVLVGDPLIHEDIEFDAGGNFVLDLGTITIPGDANPITGSDVDVTMAFAGHVVHENAQCGDVTGMVTRPLEYDLAGSTFAATRVPSLDQLPLEFPYRCDQVPPST